jgi:hypothetical protein
LLVLPMGVANWNQGWKCHRLQPLNHNNLRVFPRVLAKKKRKKKTRNRKRKKNLSSFMHAIVVELTNANRSITSWPSRRRPSLL